LKLLIGFGGLNEPFEFWNWVLTPFPQGEVVALPPNEPFEFWNWVLVPLPQGEVVALPPSEPLKFWNWVRVPLPQGLVTVLEPSEKVVRVPLPQGVVIPAGCWAIEAKPQSATTNNVAKTNMLRIIMRSPC
jgi:hypothetical protein